MNQTWSEKNVQLEGTGSVGYRSWEPSEGGTVALIVWGGTPQHAELALAAAQGGGHSDAAVLAGPLGPNAGPNARTADRGGMPSCVDVPARARQLDQFVRHVAEAHGRRPEDLIVLGSGLDATAILAWVHDYAPRIQSVVLTAPVLRIGRFGAVRGPDGPRLRVATGQRRLLRHTLRRLMVDAAAIRVPTLLLDAGDDPTAGSIPARRLMAQLDTPLKRRKRLPFIGLAFDREQERRWWCDEVGSFLADVSRSDRARPSLIGADRYGYLQDEYEWLTQPLPTSSWQAFRYRLQKLGMQSLTLLSPGIRLGMRTGFDSGQMLDYVYENEARGGPLGAWIDRIFLNNLAWEACRQRRTLTRKLLREAIQRAAASDQEVRIVDIAAGPGRYVLETLAELPEINASALLRDNTESNLEDGRRLAAELGLENVEFEWGDAFDQQSLAAIRPRPNVAVSCGLYQLFRDNQMVLRSLRGLADAVQPGGYLVYTGVPWDPVGEFAARALVNRNGDPSVLCRRTQEGLDELVRVAGFEKIHTQIDDFGVSTVSLAQRE